MELGEFLGFSFVQRALVGGLLTSIACGIIGPLVVANRMVLIAGGISHAAYGGVGLALFLGLPIFSTTLVYSIFVSIILASLTLKDNQYTDMIIGLIWSAGMALGIILMDLSPGYNVDLMSYLFGSILTLSKTDLYITFLLTVIICGVFVYFYNQFLIFVYDRDFAIISGINVVLLHYLFNILVACSIVMLIRVVGLILVLAMITIPVYISTLLCRSFLSMIFTSIFFNVFFITTGLYASYLFNISTGATIILVGTCTVFLVYIYSLISKARGAGN